MRRTTTESDTAVLLAFARLVNDMRKAQRSYFAARKQGTAWEEHLDASKRLEKAVDAMTLEVLGLTTPSLFDLPLEEPT